jgi:hypothetical protein
MPFLQDLVHKSERVADSRYLKYFLALLALILLALLYDLRAWRNLSTREAMDSAQLARNIAEGRGYTTRFIRPFSLYLTQSRSAQKSGVPPGKAPEAAQLDQAQPDITNPPVYPLVLAGLMKVAPFRYAVDLKRPFWSALDPESTTGARTFLRYQPDFFITVFNQVLFAAVILSMFLWARRWFDTAVAWVSVLVLCGMEVLWRFSVSGLSTMLLLLIFMGVAWCLALIETAVRENKGGPRTVFFLAAAAGALVALGGLTRYAFGWLIVPVVLFLVVFTDSRRAVLCLTAVGAFGILVVPWLARNWSLSGTPLGTATYDALSGTGLFPGWRLERSLDPNLRIYLWTVWMKLLVNARGLLQNELFRIGSGWIAALFLAGLLLPFRNPAVRRLRYFVLLSLGVLFLAQALGRTQLSEDSPEINSENLLVLLAPLVTVYAVAFFIQLLDQLHAPTPRIRYTLFGVFGVLTGLPTIFVLLPPSHDPVAYPPYYPPQIQQMAGMMNERELIMSDVPWAVAWYGNRPCVWLTLNATPTLNSSTHEDFFAINDRRKPINALYLTSSTIDGRLLTDWLGAGESSWGNFVMDVVLRKEVPATFPLHEMPGGLSPPAIFLADRNRWKKAE